ncbi:MAG: hypothetical protein HY716_11225 [Planctomycetes bacterium]|nr:hypothetical protein [Planctomycetota bacterium]
MWTSYGYAGWIVASASPPHLYVLRNTWQHLFVSQHPFEGPRATSEISIPRSGGDTWSDPVPPYQSRYATYVMCYRLRANGRRLFFTQTRSSAAGWPKSQVTDDAVVLMSKDGGRTWSRLNFAEGFTEDVRLPFVAFPDESSGAVVFASGPGELIYSKESEHYRRIPDRNSRLWLRHGRLD